MGLLEVVLAISLLLLIIVPMSYLFTNVIAQAASARQQVTAISLADSMLEQLNYQGPPNDTNGQPIVGSAVDPKTVTVSGVDYHEIALFSWSPAGSGTPDLCTSGLAPELLLQVTVTWSPNHTITDSTLLNFPPSGVVTEGFLGIQVNGDPSGSPPVDAALIPWSSRVVHVPILVTGTNLTSSYSLNPASNGCKFLELTTGTYSVQVGTGPTSYYTANYNEQSSETQPTSSASTISVNTDEITEVVFQYDEGANVSLQYPSTTATEDGITCPNVGGGLLCIATGQTATSSASPNTSPIATAEVKTSSGWSIATLPSSLVRIESTACSTGACMAVGYGSGAAVAAVAQASSPGTWSTSTWSNSLPGGVTSLSQIVCPTSATSPACFATGTNSSGGVIVSATISATSPHTVTWTLDTTPSFASFSQLRCPGSSATPTCFVIGTASTSKILSFTGGTTWTAYTAPGGVTATSFSSLACPSSTVCYAAGVASSAVILSLSGGTWTKDTFPASPFSLSTTGPLACPSATQCYATATGKTNSVNPVGPLILATTGTAWTNMSLPGGGAASLAQPVCASTTVCYVPAVNSSSAPLVWSLSSGSWVTDSLPSGQQSVTSIVCPSTSLCLALATTASAAAVLSTPGAGNPPTWTSDTISGTTGAPVFLSGLVCISTTSCESAGATETGAVTLDDTTTAPVFSGTGTPSGLSGSSGAGLYLDNPPILISNLNLQPSTTLEFIAATTAAAPVLSIGPLFPFASGYSVAVGSCASELAAASASASTTPGAVAPPSNWSVVTLPMGLLPIQVVNSSGAAVSGATVTITDTCSSPLTPLSGTNPASYSLPTSTVDGLSRADVIYGTYSVTVALGAANATYSLTVSPTTVTVQGLAPIFLPDAVVLAD
jgi:type II secretory pathway pseudopilin PulG